MWELKHRVTKIQMALVPPMIQRYGRCPSLASMMVQEYNVTFSTATWFTCRAMVPSILIEILRDFESVMAGFSF
jgi:hypothetical protein